MCAVFKIVKVMERVWWDLDTFSLGEDELSWVIQIVATCQGHIGLSCQHKDDFGCIAMKVTTSNLASLCVDDIHFPPDPLIRNTVKATPAI